jgi:hypothetical protein
VYCQIEDQFRNTVEKTKFIEIDRCKLRIEGVPKLTKYLLIGSTKAYSGKSAIALGMALGLRGKGLAVAYGKPLGTCFSSPGAGTEDEDVRFAVETL